MNDAQTLLEDLKHIARKYVRLCPEGRVALLRTTVFPWLEGESLTESGKQCVWFEALRQVRARG